MAIRPIYHTITHTPFCEQINTDFQFFSGFSVSQKQKSIRSLHEHYIRLHPNATVLEISSKSMDSLGVQLSAFNLSISTKKRCFSVECAFQSSKVFENGGPYIDLLDKTSREAKKDERLHSSGKLIEFNYFNYHFPLEPKDFFYNWLYINTLNLNKELKDKIMKFDSFSDIEFNPQKSINCQAKAAAIFVGLSKSGLLQKALTSREEFLKIIYDKPDDKINYEQLTFKL